MAYQPGDRTAITGRVQRLMIWSAPVGFVFLFAALVVAGWLPFPSPHQSAAALGRYYLDHVDGIRLGSAFLTLGAALLAPMAAVMAVQMRRIEGHFSPLAYLELGMGSASSLAITAVAFFWWTAAFRPDRDPVVTQSWHDAGWLCLTATVFIFDLQLLAFVLAIFTDTAEVPLFPRWLGYLAIWVCTLLMPSLLCLWFKAGPFGWNGIATLYLAFAAAGAWFAALVVQLLRVVREQDSAQQQRADPVA
jgi:hypothetical protein